VAALRICCAVACLALATAGRAAEVPFEPKPVVAAGAELPDSALSADLDGDGDLDLLLASGDAGSVSWYENSGAGSFETQRVISSAAGAVRSVLAADLDVDGDLDVVTASPDDDELAWYPNLDGAGSFGPQLPITPAGDMPVSIFLADLDGDADPDLLCAFSLDQQVVWYENTVGAGGFPVRHVISTADGAVTSVAADDVDGDGDLDVLVAAPDHAELAWYPNTDGAGSFGARQLVAGSAGLPTWIGAADLDGDGDRDVLSASGFDSEVAWYANLDGAGSFGSRQLIDANASGVRGTATADVDGDGDTDVLSASQLDAEIVWYENLDGAGLFATQWTIYAAALSATTVGAADLDGDGDTDAFSASRGGDRVVWHENRTIHRSAAFDEPIGIDEEADRVRSVFAADVDGDGDRDVLSASNGSYEIAWYANIGGSGAFGDAQLVSADTLLPAAVFAADVDGDGDQDVLFASEYDDSIWWCRNLDGAGTFGPQQRISIPIVGWPRSVSAVDLDGDGDLDALGASPGDDGLWWYENLDGTGSFGPKQLITSAADSPNSAFAADLDGDADLDVLSASGLDDKVAWYENLDGEGSFGPQQIISTAADYAYSVFAADVDGDGDVDVLSASKYDDKIAWYENLDGAGSFGGQQVITTAAASARAVLARDLDADGDLDVLSASPDDDKVAWYENLDGAGSFGGQRIISSSAGEARSVHAADLDADGDVDVLSGSFAGDRIDWYANRGGQVALPTTRLAPGAILEGATAGLLEIEAIHRGRPGDGSAELTRIELLFEAVDGGALPAGAASALIDAVFLYRDDGSGTFEPGADTLLVLQSPLAPVDGLQALPLVPGHPAAEIAYGAPVRLFVVVTLTDDAQSQTPNHLRVTHRVDSEGIARDRTYELPLKVEGVPGPLSSNLLAATPISDADLDGLRDLYETDTGIFVSATDTGTDPLDSDSDDDGFSDAEEVAAGSDPNDGEDIPPQPAPALGWGPRALMILALVLLLEQLRRRRLFAGTARRDGEG
jgi:hypothetical protein